MKQNRTQWLQLPRPQDKSFTLKAIPDLVINKNKSQRHHGSGQPVELTIFPCFLLKLTTVFWLFFVFKPRISATNTCKISQLNHQIIGIG